MYNVRTGDQALVREINLSIILNTLRDHSRMSRATLAAVTGLNKTTVSSLVQQLIDAHFVTEAGIKKTEDTGRPGMMLELNPQAGCIIGAEIGVDFISVLVTDFAVSPIWRREVHTDPRAAQATIIERTLDLIREAVAHTDGRCREVLGLGLGVPGLVDMSTGTLLFAPNLRWRNVPLKQILEGNFNFLVHVDNEANMATLGESYFGVARGARSVLYASAGVGLGGGIVLEGRVLSGAGGFAGEVGHMTLVPDGELCNCGNKGCWETVASQGAVFRRIKEGVASGADTLLLDYTKGNLDEITIPMVVQAAQQGDMLALEALEEVAVYLGIGLANLINALNPETVVFGGILSHAKDFLLPTITRVINERSLQWSSSSTKVLVAAHGFDACVMGGIASVYHQILSRPFQVSRKSGRRPSFVSSNQLRALVIDRNAIPASD